MNGLLIKVVITSVGLLPSRSYRAYWMGTPPGEALGIMISKDINPQASPHSPIIAPHFFCRKNRYKPNKNTIKAISSRQKAAKRNKTKDSGYFSFRKK